MNRQPTLEGETIRLRPLKRSDETALYSVMSDPLLWDQHPANRHEPGEFASFFEQSLVSGGCLVVLSLADQSIIGTSRFGLLSANPDLIEIGWTVLARKYWGGRYNREMKRLMVAHLSANGKRGLLNIAAGNDRSARAAEKIGGQLVTKNYHPELIDPREGYRSYVLPAAID